MNNRILMVGVLDVPSSTNVFMKKGFEQLGYYVEEYNYRTKARELGVIPMWSDFRNSLEDQEYDLIVFCKTNNMHPELLSFAKNHGPVWYWFMDPLATAEATMATEFAKYATYASATASNVVEKFKEVNLNSFHIIEGYDDKMYFYEDIEKIYDITFIGNSTPKRAWDISMLSKVIGNKKIHIFGNGWPECPPMNIIVRMPVYNEEARTVINQSKIVLNLCQDDTIFSDRVVKSLACGANVVSTYSHDLVTVFPTDVSFADNIDDLGEVIIWHFHAGMTDDQINLLPEKIKVNYSWKAVCKKILEKVK